MADWREALKAAVSRARFDEPLARHTTFKIGGPADAFVDAGTEDEVLAVLRISREFRVPVFILGWGSNLLVRDGGIEGVAIRL
ncbi:MAG: FAD-binding protein, partial [Elusimicrobia bacterium]|nr:FAD-binding protein [Elusimicrobiota bacterium]